MENEILTNHIIAYCNPIILDIRYGDFDACD